MKKVLLFTSLIFTSACAVKHTRGAPVAAAHAETPMAAPVASNSVTPVPTPSTHAEDHTGVPPETALRWLTNGNTRFLKSHLRKDGQSHADVARLSKGQHPHSIVISCSDSRVPPEVIFDQKLGEIFTVRTAGQALGHNSIGSIEYAVEHLGTKLILVMGHTSCGAVKAAFETLGGASAGSESLDDLVKDIHPRIASFKGKTASPAMEKESWANAEGVANDLIARSKILSQKWMHGQIMIVSALYDLNTGRVSFHDALKFEGARTPGSDH